MGYCASNGAVAHCLQDTQSPASCSSTMGMSSQSMPAAALRRGVDFRSHSISDMSPDAKDMEAGQLLPDRPTQLTVSEHVMQIAAMVTGRPSAGGPSTSMPESASQKGVANQRVVVTIVLCWYLVSFLGIVLNKHMLSDESPVDPRHLALVQTMTTVLLGGMLQARSTGAEMLTGGDKDLCLSRSWKKVGAIGCLGLLRFLTIVFGLISLKHVAASFTETVKASGPFFTVVAAYLFLGEKTSALRMVSLLPVVGGLMLASATELSFTTTGFVAALLTNTTECIQNVFCKQLLSPAASSSEAPYTAQQLQYYSAVAALMVQIPVFMMPSMAASASSASTTLDQTIDMAVHENDSFYNHTMMLLLWNGMLYYAQSALAYMVMSYYSPVTVAVLNTAKRAMIICGTAVVFRNQLGVATQAGTIVCISGAYLYNHFGSQGASQRSSNRSPSPRPSSPKELQHLCVESQSDDENQC
mmetsp:Transcript_48531/g.113625  ORF Transcript_48531/g.113625 Transcript_48531/m.113625 type:complete len:471 (+) Transcript_48531:85-1497(+)